MFGADKVINGEMPYLLPSCLSFWCLSSRNGFNITLCVVEVFYWQVTNLNYVIDIGLGTDVVIQ